MAAHDEGGVPGQTKSPAGSGDGAAVAAVAGRGDGGGVLGQANSPAGVSSAEGSRLQQGGGGAAVAAVAGHGDEGVVSQSRSDVSDTFHFKSHEEMLRRTQVGWCVCVGGGMLLGAQVCRWGQGGGVMLHRTQAGRAGCVL